MWPVLYLPKGITRYEKLDYNTADIAALFRELAGQDFTGYLEIVSPVQRGFFGWHSGRVYTAFYEGDDGRELAREDVLRHFLVKPKRNPETVINVTELDPRLAEASRLLLPQKPLYRELETAFIDMPRFFDTLSAKHFTGVLRFYHVRSHTRLGNILLKMNKITRDQLQQAVRLQLSQHGALRLGDALVQTGAIEPADLGSALDLQSHARKGSDIELALAVCYAGEFLGGYTHIHKQFKTGREEILPQLVGTEVLMDILEGGLPEPLDLEVLLQLPEPQVTQVEKKLSSAPAREEEPNPFADDAIHLNVEDFVLDLHPSSAPVNEAPPALPAESGVGAPSIPGAVAPAEALPAEEPGEEVAAPVIRPDFIKPSKVFSAEPAAALPPEPVEIPVEGRAAEEFGQETPESPETVPDFPEPTPPPSESAALDSSPAAASAVTAESRGLAYVMEVARDYLGPLGRTLLKKEAAPLSLQGRDWTETQVRELVLRFFRSSQWILGRARSERMLEKIRERVEV